MVILTVNIDEEVLTSLASAGLLNLSVELGIEVLRQLLGREATKLANKKENIRPGARPTATARKKAKWS